MILYFLRSTPFIAGGVAVPPFSVGPIEPVPATCITADPSNRDDLVDYMTSVGWTFIGEDLGLAPSAFSLRPVVDDHLSASWAGNQIGLWFRADTGGAGAFTTEPGEDDHPGLARFDLGTTGGTDYVSAVLNGAGGALTTMKGDGVVVFECVTRLSGDFAGGVSRLQYGVGDGSTSHFGESDNAAVIEYDPGASANWRLRTRVAAGAAVYDDLGVAPVADEWAVLRIRHDGEADEFTAEVDQQGAVASVTRAGNIPAAMQPMARCVGNGGGASSPIVWLDRLTLLST